MSPALSTALRRVRLSALVVHAAGIILATYLSGPSLLSGESLRGSNTGEEGTVASAQTSGAAGSPLVEAQEALISKNYDHARDLLEKFLETNPSSAPAHLMMADLEMRTGHSAAAILQFKRSLAIQPISFDARYGLALALLREHKVAEGVHELRRAVEINPTNTDAVYNLAVVLLDSGHPDEALRWLRSAKELGPDRPDLSYNIIRAQLQIRHFEDARKSAEASANLFGNDAAWRLAVGRLFLAALDPAEAVHQLQLANKLNPGNSETLESLVAAYLTANQPDAVLSLLPDPGNPNECYLRASAFLALHRIDEAQTDSRCSLKGSPDDPRFLLISAKIAQHRGQQEEALHILQHAAESAPRWPDVFYSEAVSHYFLSQYSELRTALDRALQLAPDSPGYLFLYAISYENEGKSEDALRYLERAIRLQPSNARFQCHLGSLLVHQNRLEQAQEAFEASLRFRPDYALPHYELGKLFESQKKFQQAAPEFEAALLYQSNLTQALYHLSRVYAGLGQKELAASTMDKFKSIKQTEFRANAEVMDDVNKQLELQP